MPTNNTLNYSIHGGSTWVVGGQLDVSGVVSVSSGGYLTQPVFTPTTASEIDVPGIWCLDGSTTVKDYVLADPVVGGTYTVFAINATSSEMVSITSTGAVIGGYTIGTGKAVTWYGAGSATLVGSSAAQWIAILAACSSGAVAITG